MSERIWFLTQRNMIIDLDDYKFFYIENENLNLISVMGYSKNSNSTRLGFFSTDDDAIEYLKEIYEVLLAEKFSK